MTKKKNLISVNKINYLAQSSISGGAPSGAGLLMAGLCSGNQVFNSALVAELPSNDLIVESHPFLRSVLSLNLNPGSLDHLALHL